MLFRQVPNMIECMLYMVQPSKTQFWSSDMSQEGNSTSWKWGHVFYRMFDFWQNAKTVWLLFTCLRLAWRPIVFRIHWLHCNLLQASSDPHQKYWQSFWKDSFHCGKNVTIRFLHVKVQSTNTRVSNTKFCVFGRIPVRIWAQNMGYPWKEHPK